MLEPAVSQDHNLYCAKGAPNCAVGKKAPSPTSPTSNSASWAFSCCACPRDRICWKVLNKALTYLGYNNHTCQGAVGESKMLLECRDNFDSPS